VEVLKKISTSLSGKIKKVWKKYFSKKIANSLMLMQFYLLMLTTAESTRSSEIDERQSNHLCDVPS